MHLPIYQVDAFSDQCFKGNPAAVCPLENWLPDALMQQIAAENNLSETAFYIPTGDHYSIRWFTSACEVDLCGHATLATAHVIYNELGKDNKPLQFESRSGLLTVSKNNEWLCLDFPVDELTEEPLSEQFNDAVGLSPEQAFKGKSDYMLIFKNADQIASMNPNFEKLSKFPVRGIIVTAPGNDCDFVSRFFAPQSGINEDPVTGSAHTSLTPYWSHRLNKTNLSARQISSRGGVLRCSLNQNRVLISGQAITYLRGSIDIEW